MNAQLIQTADLYFREGSSDKVYKATVEAQGSGYVVNFSYGRRGAALTNGTKTTSPVALEKAQSIFDKLVREKTGKGYRHVEGGESSSIEVLPADSQPRIKCLLLNAIDESEAEALIMDDDWAMQAKIDGVRLVVDVSGGEVTAYNRRGVRVPVTPGVRNGCEGLGQSVRIDGELVGDTFHPFDLVDDGDFSARYSRLKAFAARNWYNDCFVRVVETAWSVKEKKALYKRLKSDGAEGVVFKRKAAPYNEGRPASGGNYLKFKFVESATCVVASVNDKRSVGLGIRGDDGSPVFVGNVTIPPNHPIPRAGQIVEVRYLYWYENGSLYQPVYLGARDDIDEADRVSSLKKK